MSNTRAQLIASIEEGTRLLKAYDDKLKEINNTLPERIAYEEHKLKVRALSLKYDAEMEAERKARG